MPPPDVVLVGYIGHFDVHLARLLFRGVPVILDHLVGASATGRDRRLDGGPRQVLLRLIDAAALRAADVVVVDTEEHLAALPARHRRRAVVVPVGAPAAWYAAGQDAAGGRARRASGTGARTAARGVLRPVHPAAGHAGHRRGAEPAGRGPHRGHHDR